MTQQIQMSSPDLTAAERAAVLEVLETPFLSMENRDRPRSIREYTGRSARSQSLLVTGLLRPGRRHARGRHRNHIAVFLCSICQRAAMRSIRSSLMLIRAPWHGSAVCGAAARDIAAAGRQTLASQRRRRTRWPAGHPGGGCIRAAGRPGSIRQVATEHGLGMIEDACEALAPSTQPTGRDVGDSAGMPSIQTSRSTGEGGMIVTDDEAAAALMRCCKSRSWRRGCSTHLLQLAWTKYQRHWAWCRCDACPNFS
jgi:hypothetical protein